MSISKMSLITIRGDIDKLDEVLNKCAGSGVFHFEQASAFADDSAAAPLQKLENPYAAVLSDIVALASDAGFKLKYTDFSDYNQPLDKIEQYVGILKGRLDNLLQKKLEVSNEIAVLEQASTHFEHIRSLDANLDELFSCRYVKIRFGKLPLDSVLKLSYYDDKPFVYLSFDKDKNYDWGVYLTAEKDSKEIDALFSTLYFERLRLPDYTHGTPAETRKNVVDKLAAKFKELEAVTKKINTLLNGEKERFRKAYCKIKFLKESYDLRKYVLINGSSYTMVGFVPHWLSDGFVKSLYSLNSLVKVLYDKGKKRTAVFIKDGERIDDDISAEGEERFYNLLDTFKPLEITVKPPEKEKRVAAPILLNNSRLTKPFELFVTMYGMPSYSSLDPTIFVSFTYTLLFGIMFGDVGQGLLLSLIGWYLAKYKDMPLGGVLNRIGFSSAFFGLVYGSVFGFEDALNPLYKALFGLSSKPVHVFESTTTNLILILAVGLGALFIMLSIAVNIYLGFKTKDWSRALFSNNGLSGLIFYGSVIAAFVLSVAVPQSKIIGTWFIIGFIIIPLIIVFMREPLGNLIAGKPMFHDGFGAFFAENFFEMFEVLLSYVSNTMSFLRVGGFILSHAGMMMVVFQISESINSGASIIVIIFGNLLVMAIEGLIVGIQVLRLEFYEMFSRFNDGDGKAYQPVKINFN